MPHDALTYPGFGYELRVSLLAISLLTATSALATPTVSPEEQQQKDQWVEQNLLSESGSVPFSFICAGRPSGSLLPSWERKVTRTQLDNHRTQHVITWTDPKSGLEARCQAVDYDDFPVIEWTLYLKNAGQADTPILSDIQGLDASFQREGEEPFVLRTTRGDDCSPASYQPVIINLGDGARQKFSPAGGRPTTGAYPYFNLAWSGGGVIAALGWPGQWAASFTCDKQTLRMRGGQELTHLTLWPGEEIRAPLIALLFWRGDDVVRAQNLWRRWFMAHNIPHPNNKPPAPLAHVCCEGFFNFTNGIPEMRLWVESFAKAGIKLDYCWRDAGWYPCRGSWVNTGTWEPDPVRFPNGFKPFSDWLHARGLKFIVWFEPERVTAGSWLAKRHAEWVLGGSKGGLLNLGHPDAWKWLVGHIDKLITDEGIDLYRQDFNIDPLNFWRGNDAPDRQGITENRHVQGYLAFWDELQRRHPGMLIDSCASGGRRNDLETLRRAVPLLRSDYQGGPDTALGNQGHTFGISSWIPYYGSGVYATDKYSTRSYFMPAFSLGVDARGNADWAGAKRDYDECRRMADYMLDDFYPLTPYNLDKKEWIAWQFNQPETGEGVVQAFCRPDCPDSTMKLKLHDLDPRAAYRLTDFDKPEPITLAGRELMEEGLTLDASSKPASFVIVYKTIENQK